MTRLSITLGCLTSLVCKKISKMDITKCSYRIFRETFQKQNKQSTKELILVLNTEVLY